MSDAPADSPFTAADLAQMADLGVTEDEARRHIALFENPPPPLHLLRPASHGDGIQRIERSRHLPLEVRWADISSAGRIAKFVPASGAASRMFRPLEAIHHGAAASHAELERRAAAGDEDAERALTFLDRMERFAFFEDLDDAVAAAGLQLDKLRRAGAVGPILDHLLDDAGGHGLLYATSPKGLIPFHRYPGGERRSAFEEHMVEAVGMLRDEEAVCRLHFTVSPLHRESFEAVLETVRERYEERYECSFEIDFSYQSHATDTLAVDPDNRPFRLEDGSLLLRPGGHGALLDNLDSLDAEVVLIKNVDNVLPEGRQEPVLLWKRLLIGKLAELRDRSSDLLSRLESTGGDDAELLTDGEALAADLGNPMPAALTAASAAKRRAWLIDRLDRPLRVCGMVENAGEPGGGPFWVRGADGSESLQIVEKNQIALDDPQQAAVVAAATHFNPVDLVCALTDRSGHPYELVDYVDPAAVFIAEKFHQGLPLKALERPGLWNGAMAGWNTVFVEVPQATFAPVKNVFDLLRDVHQTGVAPKRR